MLNSMQVWSAIWILIIHIAAVNRILVQNDHNLIYITITSHKSFNYKKLEYTLITLSHRYLLSIQGPKK